MHQHLAGLHNVNAIRHGQNFAHLVIRDEDADALILEAADDLLNVGYRLRVDAGERLVKEDDERIANQAAGDFQPPRLAAGQPGRVVLAKVAEAERSNTSSVFL